MAMVTRRGPLTTSGPNNRDRHRHGFASPVGNGWASGNIPAVRRGGEWRRPRPDKGVVIGGLMEHDRVAFCD